MRSIAYYATTTVSAVILGIILVTVIRPGDHAIGAKTIDDKTPKREVTTADTMLDLIR